MYERRSRGDVAFIASSRRKIKDRWGKCEKFRDVKVRASRRARKEFGRVRVRARCRKRSQMLYIPSALYRLPGETTMRRNRTVRPSLSQPRNGCFPPRFSVKTNSNTQDYVEELSIFPQSEIIIYLHLLCLLHNLCLVILFKQILYISNTYYIKELEGDLKALRKNVRYV